MMNIIKSGISILLVIIVFSMINSCGENWALKEETFTIADENDGWVPGVLKEAEFMMVDDNGISVGFTLQDEEIYLDKSWGGYFGLTTHMTFTESRYRTFSSTYGFTFRTSIRASTWEPYGDELSIAIDDIDLTFDLGLEMVTRIYTYNCNKSYSQTSEGYEKHEIIQSTGEVLSSFEVMGTEYEDVLHLHLEDCTEDINDFTVRDIYYARETGLIKFTLDNGLSYSLND